MSPDEKLAIQTTIVQFLERASKDHPTLLVDTLLSGDGWNLVHAVLAREEAYARGRAQTMHALLGAILQDRTPPAAPPPPPSPFAAGLEEE